MDGDRENAYYVTVSAGIFVMCRDKKISTEDTLSRADERLYEAKKHKTQMLIKSKQYFFFMLLLKTQNHRILFPQLLQEESHVHFQCGFYPASQLPGGYDHL